jgi:hypothetical protein
VQERLRATINIDLKSLSRIVRYVVMEARGYLVAEPEGLALASVRLGASMFGRVHSIASIAIIKPCPTALSVRTPVVLLDFR